MDGKIISALVFSLATSGVFAQTCKEDSIETTAPKDRYIIDYELGTVIDVETRLMWDICSLGQTYEGKRCTGEPTHFSNVYDAFQTVPTSGPGSFKNYRLPNIKELDSIVERQCNTPAINLNVFTDSPSAVYLSSTPTAVSINGDAATRNINFEDGSDIYGPESYLRYVRLVRDMD